MGGEIKQTPLWVQTETKLKSLQSQNRVFVRLFTMQRLFFTQDARVLVFPRIVNNRNVIRT
jgi:hypothetical protein